MATPKFDPAVLVTEADIFQAARWKKYPFEYLTETNYTKDEVRAGEPEVIRLIPKLPHVELFCKLWQSERLLTVVKSRRMLFSWMCSGLELWLTSFTQEAHVAVIAQDQSGSEKFLGRVLWLYNHLPPKCPRPEIRLWMGLEGNPKKIMMVETGSTIEAFPGIPDKIRGEGKSLVRCEEIAFWPKAAESWAAILPTIQGGGRVVCISTPLAGSWYQNLVQDTLLASVPN